MVEHVLRDNAPNDELADKVFALLNPSEGVFNDRKTLETFENIGGAGKDGFTRAMALPHWRSRRLTVQYFGHGIRRQWSNQGIRHSAAEGGSSAFRRRECRHMLPG